MHAGRKEFLSWEKEFPWSEMETDNEQRRLRELKKIAAVNLKKTSGGHTSNNGEIYRAAVDHHDIIKEQIDLYKSRLYYLLWHGVCFLWMYVIRTEKLTGK